MITNAHITTSSLKMTNDNTFTQLNTHHYYQRRCQLKIQKKPKGRPLEIEFFLPQTPTSILAPCLQALAVNLLNLQHYARTFSLGTAVDNRVQCNFSVHVWSSLLSIRNSNMIRIRLLRSKTKVDRNKGTKLDD